MRDQSNPKFLIAGGGLGGALMANYLGQFGFAVEVYEMRGDLRATNAAGGRSINLALSHRGICALQRVGLADEVLQRAVPMRGRMIHAIDGRLSFQPYGVDASQAIYSVSRSALNQSLLHGTERFENVRLHFYQKCTDVDLDEATLHIEHAQTGARTSVRGDIIVSADGAFSAVRRAMQKLDRFDYRQEYLAHGYKELSIPPGPDGLFRMERNALHIWPRRSFMMIALPNEDASYTCTIFWPFEGAFGFDAVRTKEELLALYHEQFPDAIPMMPTLAEDYFANPTGSLVTIRCGPWYYKDKVVLLGDACHAVVPFYGQGMNAAFEDVLVFAELFEAHRPDWERVFREYYAARKEDADTLANLAIANFIEMRDHTGSKAFLFSKKIEKWLHRLLPRWYVPLYTMVTFTRMSYAAAVRRSQLQDRVVLAALIAVLIVLAVLVLVFVR